MTSLEHRRTTWMRLAATAALALTSLCTHPATNPQTSEERADGATALSQALGGVRLGARVQVDHGSFDGVHTGNGRSASATYLRRGEVSVGTRLGRDWRASALFALQDDKLEVDLATLSWQPRDGLRISAGRLDPDFGLDNANSSSWTAGIERSAIYDLAPGIADSEGGWGLRVHSHGPRWSVGAGLYDKSGPRAAVGRAVWIVTPAEGRALHVGASLARSQGLDTDGRLRSRLGVRGVTETAEGRRSDLAPGVRRPGRYDGDTVVGLELALQRGPWLLQAEALSRALDAVGGAPRRSVTGASLQLAWSPNGLVRRYDAAEARFGRPRGERRSAGRWELFYRFDTLNGVDSLAAQVHTVGASWFHGNRWRLSANAMSSQSDDPNSAGNTRGHGLALRAQAVF